jgi:alkanesulfonate monooxygenase SsuD/methylene tetrahydromethanopterin reductase-like flavin-dependent oxidoreductase (luciferase family)/uncharacterized protein YndB with AHSA1/START domain
LELGIHLPLMEFGDEGQSLDRLVRAVDAARDAGFAAVSANDHFLFQTPWLDGPTALAAVIDRSGSMELATTVALVSLRGPMPLAKTLAALDLLSDGRVVAGVGPGSSQRDYDALGVPFDDRWRRFEDAVVELRRLLAGTVPIWIGSWGSKAGMRRVERLADGWFASAYNTTPERFEAARAALPDGFPNALVTMWTWITEDARDADRVLHDVLTPLLHRDADELRGQLCVGPAERCAELLARYADAGCRRVHLWPIGDEPEQIERAATMVLPAVAGGSGELTLELERVLEATPARVFRALSEPEELRKWWGPHGVSVPSLDFTAAVGRRYRIEMQPPEGDPFVLNGEFREVDPPTRLAYTFAWQPPEPDDVENLVELSVRERGGSSEVVMTQGPFATEARRELHRHGWTDSFDKLERLLRQG